MDAPVPKTRLVTEDIDVEILALLMDAKEEIVISAYKFDWEDGCNALAQFQGKVRVLLDLRQFQSPSAKRQYERMMFVMERCEFRTMNTTDGLWTMHAKSICIDGTTYVGGSCNFSTAAMKRNREHCVITTEPSVVEACLQWHADLWERGSSEVTTRQVEASLAKQAMRLVAH